MHDYFAQDLTPGEKNIVAANQGQTNGNVFKTPLHNAAWKSKPSWYIVSANDKTIHPDEERSTAKSLNAKTLTIPTSHVPMLSPPEKVAEYILGAVKELNA